ncbi:DUF6499 domain-containing protein [Mesorhizobium sp. WSM2239]|uniref:DUF6499 domain-containing protein n=2 Tax=unclassified Mesorhizobium TaxID=325217 RepID=A0AAU8D5U6_9HYPH
MSLADGTAAHQPDWWDERSYDYATQLTRRGWAWEFLRRNPAFQRDLIAAQEQVRYQASRPPLDVIESAADLSRWGVSFRGLARV